MNNNNGYGYADNLNGTILGKIDINQANENIEKWLDDNKMKPNTGKFHVLNIKSDLNSKLVNTKPALETFQYN